MSDCGLITEQRMRGLLCRSMTCEPCIEFRELNDDYLVRKTREIGDAKIIVKQKQKIDQLEKENKLYEKVNGICYALIGLASARPFRNEFYKLQDDLRELKMSEPRISVSYNLDAQDLLKQIDQLEKDNEKLKNMLKATTQNICELLEYSEVDNEVGHVWANAEDAMYRARQTLEELTNGQ